MIMKFLIIFVLVFSAFSLAESSCKSSNHVLVYSSRLLGALRILWLCPPSLLAVREVADRVLAVKANGRTRAFSSVAGFNLSELIASEPNCSVFEIRMSFRNLTGVISWTFLRNLTRLRTLDLSNNSLKGYVTAWLWSNSTVVEINFSRNKLGGAIGVSASSKPVWMPPQFPPP
nr:probable LRR receptor-like serine/threonine-protein kinase At2g24230 [Ipomoea batatas]